LPRSFGQTRMAIGPFIILYEQVDSFSSRKWENFRSWKRTVMAFRTLLIGDIVGRPGRLAVTALLPKLIQEEQIDLVIANGENAAGGSGITPAIFEELLKAGVDLVTMGDHCYRKKEAMALYEKSDRLLRPANLPEAAAGRAWSVVKTRGGAAVAALTLLGRTFMKPIDCPFRAVERALEAIGQETRLIFVDMHAEATSDKIAMGWYLDGRVTCVFGTHTHIQTADERVLPQGTAYITDLGMTGPYDGVLGRDKRRVLSAMTTGVPTFFEVATGDVRVCGAIVTADGATGKAQQIRRVSLPYVMGQEQGAYDAADGKGGGKTEEF